jgi:hypothetical protein
VLAALQVRGKRNNSHVLNEIVVETPPFGGVSTCFYTRAKWIYSNYMMFT